MADGLAVERLRHYLRGLSPQACAMLIGELERAQTRGDETSGNDLILAELRRFQPAPAVLADPEPVPTAPVVANPADKDVASRAFFTVLDPFVVDDVPSRKHRGRVARASLLPIWDWLGRDAMPDLVGNFAAELGAALEADNNERSERVTRSFQDRVVLTVREMIAGAADEKARRKIAARIGTPQALEEIDEILTILSAREWLAVLAAKLPTRIRTLADEKVDTIRRAVESHGGSGDDLLYALLLVMSRMDAPWQLVRLAVRAASSDVASRIAETPYKVAVSIVFNDIERMVAALRAELPNRGSASAHAHLKSIHDAVRGLRTEIAASPESPWGRKLAAIRSEVSAMLKSELEAVPGNVRRLLRPRTQKDVAVQAALDAHDIVEVEAQLDLVMACRNFAGELALSETMLRTFSELQHYLEQNTQSLLEGLRVASETERPFRQSQIDASVRFCAKVFGVEYAALLAKAADLAAREEKKAQRA